MKWNLTPTESYSTLILNLKDILSTLSEESNQKLEYRLKTIDSYIEVHINELVLFKLKCGDASNDTFPIIFRYVDSNVVKTIFTQEEFNKVITEYIELPKTGNLLYTLMNGIN